MRRTVTAASMAVVMAVGLAAAAAPGAIARPSFCRDVIRVEQAPARFSLDRCNAVGRPIVGHGVTTRVPRPGTGISILGASTGHHPSLHVRTTPDGIVEILTHEVPTESPATMSAAAASNDAYATPTDLDAAGRWTATGTTVAATRESWDDQADAACAEDPVPQHTVWYRVISTSYGEVPLVATGDTGIPLTVQVFTESYDQLSPNACAPDSLYRMPDTTYMIRVGSTTPTAFTLHPPRPFNDDFASALSVAPGYDATPEFQTDKMLGATVEAGEPNPSCKAGADGTVWHRIDPGTLRRLNLNDSGGGGLALYSGSTLTGLTPRACLLQAWGRYVTLPAKGPYYIQQWTEGIADASLYIMSGEPYPDMANPCDAEEGQAYWLLQQVARKPFKWSFNGEKTPGSLAGKALPAIKQGVGIITGSKNDCGMADEVAATAEYLGTTSRTATMCTKSISDGVSTIDFGPASDYGVLGIACSSETLTSSGQWRVTETDIRMTRGANWTLSPDSPDCAGGNDFVGVVAHEVGHGFGLDHPYAQGNQTMSGFSTSCNGGFRSLGRGDVRGLRTLY